MSPGGIWWRVLVRDRPNNTVPYVSLRLSDGSRVAGYLRHYGDDPDIDKQEIALIPGVTGTITVDEIDNERNLVRQNSTGWNLVWVRCKEVAYGKVEYQPEARPDNGRRERNQHRTNPKPHLCPVSTTLRATEVKLGDCFTEYPSGSRISSLNKVSCGQPHRAEVCALLIAPDGPYPGRAAMDGYISKCGAELASYSPTAVKDPTIDMHALFPTPKTWDKGDRVVACIATTADSRTGSIKG
jgi:hypothetical protein